MDEITSVFVTESREQLAALEAALLELESRPGDDDTLNAIFRSAHTIKGGAGVIECGYIVAFTHVVENVLDKLRNAEITLDSDLIALLLVCSDHIGNLLGVLESGASAPDADLAAEGEALLARLQRDWLSGERAESRSGPPTGGVLDSDRDRSAAPKPRIRQSTQAQAAFAAISIRPPNAPRNTPSVIPPKSATTQKIVDTAAALATKIAAAPTSFWAFVTTGRISTQVTASATAANTHSNDGDVAPACRAAPGMPVPRISSTMKCPMDIKTSTPITASTAISAGLRSRFK